MQLHFESLGCWYYIEVKSNACAKLIFKLSIQAIGYTIYRYIEAIRYTIDHHVEAIRYTIDHHVEAIAETTQQFTT